jgi:hypothetical protein
MLNNLTLSNSTGATATSTFTSSSTTLSVAGTLTIGNASDSNKTVLDLNTYDLVPLVANLAIASKGTLYGSNSTPLVLSGNFTNTSGTYTHNNGTISFNNNSTPSTISSTADMSFYNMSVTTPGKTLKFQKHTSNTPKFTIANQMMLTGGSVEMPVYVESDTAGSQWLVNFSTPQTNITFVSVKDSACDTGSQSVAFSFTNGGRGNNGSCWNINNTGADGSQVIRSVEQGSGGGTVRGGGGSGTDGSTEGGSGGGQTQGGGGAGGGGAGGGAGGGTP